MTWKKIPELPLVQPEKVVTLPLDLTLDKTYDYRLTGEDTVEGRPAYVLAFDPAAGKSGSSLYRGRVWIDRETFVRLKVAVVQTNLEPPAVSNDETDAYIPVEGRVPDDGRADGPVWAAGGRTSSCGARCGSTASRSIRRRRASIKPWRRPTLPTTRWRDTDQGFRYLQDEGGGRAVKTTLDTSQLFLAGGLFKDNAIDTVVPLAGVNWFDYNFLEGRSSTSSSPALRLHQSHRIRRSGTRSSISASRPRSSG